MIKWLDHQINVFNEYFQPFNRIKLQGSGKSIDVMYDIIGGFGSKLELFKRDIDNNNFKYFPLLKDHLQNFLFMESMKWIKHFITRL